MERPHGWVGDYVGDEVCLIGSEGELIPRVVDRREAIREGVFVAVRSVIGSHYVRLRVCSDGAGGSYAGEGSVVAILSFGRHWAVSKRGPRPRGACGALGDG